VGSEQLPDLEDSMYIIVGLGNPDIKYQATRHNIGFDAVTAISDKTGISLNTRKHKAVIGKGVINGHKVLLAQPQTYMNVSGESVRELVDFYKIDPTQELIIIYDDINLPVGQLRIRERGSAGGHNGIKNIISCLGTQEFMRIKIGVGNKPPEWDLVDWVLARFPDEQEPDIRTALLEAYEAVQVMMDEGVSQAMNRFNARKRM